MSKPTILFVDDEPHILSGLRRSLSDHRDAWDLYWADGAAAALECLSANQIDILVTDMRMPGMDGAELLDRARRAHPTTARIVLSGHADRDSIVAAAGPTQQFLSKPCDPDDLIRALESAVATRALMADLELSSVFGGQENLPKPPAIYAELVELTGRPDTTVAQVARVVERDVATATELLKLVNSSFFGVAHEVSTVSQAVVLLGLDVIKALVLAGRAFRPSRSLPVGLSAREVADLGARACLAVRSTGAAEGWSEALTSQICLAALLHDVGLLVLAGNDPAAWKQYQRARLSGSERTAQVDAFGCTIGQASAYLLGLWGFHDTVVRTLAEQPVDLDDDAVMNASPAALVVALARQVAAEEGPAEPADHAAAAR